MNFLQQLALLSLVYSGYGRPHNPTSNDDTNRAMKDAKTHFGDLKDFKEIEIPPIVKTHNPPGFNLTNDGSGNYYFSFDDYPLARSEVGELKNAGTDNEIQTVRGQYVVVERNENGEIVTRTIGYVADENGFRPFLISIEIQEQIIQVTAVGPGGPGGKTEISSATIGSLVGGNFG